MFNNLRIAIRENNIETQTKMTSKKIIAFSDLLVLVSSVSITASPFKKDSTSASTKTMNKENQVLKFSGYFDTYYFANFNQPTNNSNLGNSGVARGFDRYA